MTNETRQKLLTLNEKINEISQEGSSALVNELAVLLQRERDMELITQDDFQSKLIQWGHLLASTSSLEEEDEVIGLLKKRNIGIGLPPLPDFSKEKISRFIWFRDQHDLLKVKKLLLERYCSGIQEYKETMVNHLASLKSSHHDSDIVAGYVNHYQENITELESQLQITETKIDSIIKVIDRRGLFGCLFRRKIRQQQKWEAILKSIVDPMAIQLSNTQLNEVWSSLGKQRDHLEILVYMSQAMNLYKQYKEGLLPESFYRSYYMVCSYEMIGNLRNMLVPGFSSDVPSKKS